MSYPAAALTEYMLDHVLDNVKIINGTVDSYIAISKTMNLPTAFLEHIKTQLELLLAQKLITC